MIKNRRAFIIGIKSTILSNKEKIFLKKYKPWGVILFSRNIKELKQTKKLTSDIRLIFKELSYKARRYGFCLGSLVSTFASISCAFAVFFENF